MDGRTTTVPLLASSTQQKDRSDHVTDRDWYGKQHESDHVTLRYRLGTGRLVSAMFEEVADHQAL